ncbi:hypothetical protein C0Q70_06241 [Pomacea canaliculata]|uniref:Rho-GAP domain-containing protein n=1 Tax=Pomacea canaliculata TaxID=400727 RepID=A0A2T7PNF8_POMCA|nr:hypothetical protein C0Q70_06241 [Pomacea canaliculata]
MACSWATNDESDEEDLCALSDRWEYQKNVRRWSRKGVNNEAVELSLHPTISHDSLLADQESGSHTDDSPLLDNKMPCVPLSIETVQDRLGPSVQLEVPLVPEFKEQTLSSSHFFPVSPRLRRSASERIKSALKKMDSFKRKPKRHVVHLSPVEISGPVVTDQEGMQAKLQHLKCMDLSLPDAANRLPSSTGMSTPIYPRDKVSKTESSPLVSPVTPITATSPSLSDDPSACTHSASKSESSLSEYYAAHSQLLAIFQQHGSKHESDSRRNNGENSLLEIFLLPEDHKPGSFPRLLHNGYIDTNTSPTSTGHRPVNKQQKHLNVDDLLHENHSFEGISAKEEPSLSQTPDDEEGSNSNSSHDLSEGEDADDVSPNDSQEKVEKPSLERRDSGVGSSLTRRPSISMKDLQVWGLSVCQLLPLRQLSLLRLTAIMEKCSPASRSQWTWSVPRFMKRNKSRQFDGKNVFGVPLMVMQQRTGQPLPQCVLYAMRYLRRTAHTAVGIFRKSGVRSRIQKLRDMVEAYPDSINFDELQPYDIADLLKQYFRELPECLLTNKLSETFRSIFTYVPEVQRLEALQNAVILLPEENQEVLYSLLLFLSDIAQQADAHQMTASNLAVCFAPSLFNFVGSLTNSPRRQRKNPGIPEQHELLEQKAVHECFTFMITNCKKLFMVPSSTYSRLHLSTLCNMEPVHLDEFYATPQQPGPDFRSFGEEHIQVLLKEVHDKNRGWIVASINLTGIEVMYRKPQDNHPLKQWKCSVEIEAPPIEVLNRILHERHTWDDDLLSWLVLERLDRHADVFQYVLNCMAPHPPRVFTVLRYWRPDLAKEACAVVSQSVEHEGAPVGRQQENGVRAVELGTSFLMEPCGSGRSRLTYIARTDLRGRCPEWYNRVYGHQCALLVERLRDSFRQEADGPETKV